MMEIASSTRCTQAILHLLKLINRLIFWMIQAATPPGSSKKSVYPDLTLISWAVSFKYSR